MSKDDDKKPSKIDFSKFRISINNTDLPIAKKVIVNVLLENQVNKICKRFNPDNDNKLDCAI